MLGTPTDEQPNSGLLDELSSRRETPTTVLPGQGLPPVGEDSGSFDEETALYQRLVNRASRRRPLELTLSREEEDSLVRHIDRDFNDALSVNIQFRDNHASYLRNWRTVTADDDELPYEGASNIRVPLTSHFIETWKARILKVLFGGDKICEFTSLDPAITPDALQEVNDWFNWELKHIVNIAATIEDVLHYTLLDGFGLAIPTYHHEERVLSSIREFDLVDELPLSEQLLRAVMSIWPGEEVTIEGQPKAGRFDITHRGVDKKTRKGTVVFLIEGQTLIAEVESDEVFFDGVKIELPDLEDLFVINSAYKINDIPFFGLRVWISVHDYLMGIEDGTYRRFDDDEVVRICSMALDKQAELDQQYVTKESDRVEGSQSQDVFSVHPSRRWIQHYRWEGWWTPGYVSAAQGESTSSAPETVGKDAIQIVAWLDIRARRIVRVEKLESLNKTGERTPIKFDFIVQPNRFLSIGLAEWIRHNQEVIDAIYRQRLDSGTLSNIPFGFYEPAAGFEKTIFQLEPGKMYPVKDTSKITFPKLNFSPAWGFQEEAVAKRYAQEQAGLSDVSVGNMPSKRLTATEATSTSGAIDLRTEVIVNRFMRSMRDLLVRIFGLYQQFAPDGRIFQVTGQEGETLVRRFKRDRLNGKMSLQLTGNVQQLNDQLARDTSVNMLSLLLNQFLIQSGIVKQDTIHAAVTKVTRALDYRGVPIHLPDMPPDSDSPDVEHRKMYAGVAVQPSMTENAGLHLEAHSKMLIDPAFKTWTPDNQQLLVQHIMATQQLIQAKALMRQQQQQAAAAMQGKMAEMGVRPGMAGGQQTGDQQEPGTQEEGAGEGPTEQMGGV